MRNSTGTLHIVRINNDYFTSAFCYAKIQASVKENIMKIVIILLSVAAISLSYCTQDDESDNSALYDVGELYGKCKEDGTCNNGLQCIKGFCRIVTDSSGTWGGSFSGGNNTPDSGTQDTGGNTPGNCKDYTCKGCCNSSGYCIEPGNLDTACGKNSSPCTDCTASNKICSDGYCTDKTEICSMTNCTGCCGTDQKCHSGFSDSACGNKGTLCTDCTTTNQKCVNGYCQ